jgi:hypothetical protein
MSYVLVFVTSKTCGHCITFKQQQMDKLIKNLIGIENLHIINISTSDMGFSSIITRKNDIVSYNGVPNETTEKVNSNKPVVYYIKGGNIGINYKIVNLVKGFPQFFLFTKDAWTDSKGSLFGLIYNHVINSNGSVDKSKETSPNTAEYLSDWVKSGISNYNNILMVPVLQKSPQSNPMPGYISPSKIVMKFSHNTD